MSRSDNFDTRVIRTFIVIAVLGGFFFWSSVVCASPVTSSSQPSSPLVGTLDEDSLSWGGGASIPAPSSVPASAVVAPLLTTTTKPSGVAQIKPMAVVPVEKELVGEKTDNKVFDDSGLVKVLSENMPRLLIRIETLEKRIGKLEEEIGKLQQNNVSGKKASNNDVKVKKVSKVKKVKRKVKVSRKKAPEWVLKAARPGMAWVSEKGSSKLRTVTVGEKLDGIGKINAIVKDSSGYWVVDGVSGRISQ
ncbi:MAG: hypothetical protein KAI76_01320 [Alphaproteobacteria bacterium]|nr:hypothetical protein [Alphaproteobacteria bacterium]